MTVAGRTAFLTGATGGLGAALTHAMAARCSRIALFARNRDRLDALMADLDAHRHGSTEIRTYVGDLADAVETERMVREALASFGPPDWFVHAAGHSPEIDWLEAGPDDAWDRAMNVNARSAFLATRLLLPSAKARGSGRFVYVASAVATTRVARIAAYQASKAALRSFALSLREETRGTGLAISVVSPEPMDTPMRWAITPNHPRDAVLPASEVAGVIVDLLENERRAHVDEVIVRVG